MGSAHPETVSNRLPKPRPIRILGSAQCFYVEKSSSNGLPKHGSHFASDETRDANLRPLSFLCVSSGGSHHHELGDDRSRGGARGRPSPGPSSPAPGRSAPGRSSPALASPPAGPTTTSSGTTGAGAELGDDCRRGRARPCWGGARRGRARPRWGRARRGGRIPPARSACGGALRPLLET